MTTPAIPPYSNVQQAGADLASAAHQAADEAAKAAAAKARQAQELEAQTRAANQATTSQPK